MPALARRTLKARILDLLRDGRKHSTFAVHQLGTSARTRISEMNHEGYVIEQGFDGHPSHSWYQLVSEPKRVTPAGLAGKGSMQTTML